MPFCKQTVLLFAILSVSLSEDPKDARTIEYVNERFPDGGYHFRFIENSRQEKEDPVSLEEGSGNGQTQHGNWLLYLNQDQPQEDYKAVGSNELQSSDWKVFLRQASGNV